MVRTCAPLRSPICPGDRVQVYEMEGAEARAFTVLHGPFTLIKEAHEAIVRWAAASGHCICGPSREVYLQSSRRRAGSGSSACPRPLSPLPQKTHNHHESLGSHDVGHEVEYELLQWQRPRIDPHHTRPVHLPNAVTQCERITGPQIQRRDDDRCCQQASPPPKLPPGYSPLDSDDGQRPDQFIYQIGPVPHRSPPFTRSSERGRRCGASATSSRHIRMPWAK